MRDLERRYSRLLRLFYPGDYVRARGTEVVDTYLALAGPDRRWPSVADMADAADGGLRQRVRAAGVTDIGPGMRLAGMLALLGATALAAVWSVLELHPLRAEWAPPAGPFVTLGVGVWAAWLTAAAAHLVAPGRWARLAIGVAVLCTVAVVPVAALTQLPRPPLLVLLPQAALGIVALACPGRLPVGLRPLPLATGAAAGLIAVDLLGRGGFPAWYYGSVATRVLAAVGAGLLVLALAIAVGLALRNDHRGGWAVLVLLGPTGMLSLRPLAEAIGVQNPTWATFAAVAVAVAVIAPAVVAVAIAARRRLRRGRTGGRCPSCGAPT
jgi:hypothetical protein